MTLEERLRCLIKEEDVAKLEAELDSLDKDLFSITLSRIIRVINYNYFREFFLLELLALTHVHAEKMPPLGFNSNGESLPDVNQSGRQANIFAFLASNKPKAQKVDNSQKQSMTKAVSDVKVIRKVNDIAVTREKGSKIEKEIN